MIAEPGRTYAQVIDGRVHWIFTAKELPEWNQAQLPAFDITDLKPQPVQGWLCDVEQEKFSPPPAAPQREVLLQQLAAIDLLSGMNRGVREVVLAFGTLTKMMNSVAFKDANGNLVPDTTVNVGMVKTQDVENQAKQLRSQLAALPPE